jgi:hypothetical protein
MEGNDSSQEKYGKIQFTEPSLRVFFDALDLGWIEGKIAVKYSVNKRRPPLPFLPQIRAHLFKDLRQIKSYRKLAKVLAENNGFWARLLGFKAAPHHDSFSAFRIRLGPDLFLGIFTELRNRLLELQPDLAELIVIDSASIPAYGRPARGGRKPSDSDAMHGICIDPKTGKKKSFFGYKLHSALSAKYGAPISFTVTPGNRSDSPQFRKLIKMLSEAQLPFEVAIADAGYDARENYLVAIKHNAIPIIAYNRRRKPKGTTGRRLDRILPILRNSPEWDAYYRLRSSVERQFSELKEQLGMRNLTLRSLSRVTIHLCISMIVLLAINLVAHLTGNPELLRSIEPWRYSNV